MSRAEHFSAGTGESRRELFHGTVADIATGGLVVPAARSGHRSVHGDVGRNLGQTARSYAFATERESEAWDFADHAANAAASRASTADDPYATGGRTRVYRVEPIRNSSRLGVFHPDHPNHGNAEVIHEHVSRAGFKVTGREDIHPGNQGTIPIDWNPYRRNDYWDDVNHPTPGDQLGHISSQFAKVNMENDYNRVDQPPGADDPYRDMAHEMTRSQVPGQGELFDEESVWSRHRPRHARFLPVDARWDPTTPRPLARPQPGGNARAQFRTRFRR